MLNLFQNKDDLPSLSVRRPITIVVLNILIIIAGLSAILGLEVRELPDVDRPIVSVHANFPGGSPETVDNEVTRRIEGAAARVSGIKSIRAQSEEGSARVRVEFRPGVNIEDAANEMREAVSRVQRQLPEEVEQLSIIKADNDASSVLDVAIGSDHFDTETIAEIAERDISPLFLSIPGVADVQLNGERQRVLRVVVDPIRLASYRLSFTHVANALKSAPFDVAAGSLRSTAHQVIVRADATSVTTKQVEQIVIKGTTRVGDVATVFFGPADAQSLVRLNGKPVIGLGIVRQASANTIEISDQALAMVEEIKQRYPELDVYVTNDDAQFIRSSVEEVIKSLAYTIALVVFTLWLFLGSWRATIVPALSIPVSLVGVLVIIWFFGFSINILTLLALVLATGLIVDDAIVVSENIQRHKSLGVKSRAAAVVGSREVFFAVIATTAVLVAVFLPIAFLPSTAGKLFREFGSVLAGAVIISSFVALTLVPALKAKIASDSITKTENITAKNIQRIGQSIVNGYEKALHFCIKYGWLILLFSLLAAGSATLLYDGIDKELMPSEDRGSIRIVARGPDGVGVSYMDRQAKVMEDIMMPYAEQGDIASLRTVVAPWDPNVVLMNVKLKDWAERENSQQKIISEIRPRLASVPGAPGRASGGNSLNLRSRGGGLEFAITGSNYEDIFTVTQSFAKQVEDNYPEFGQLDISYQPTQPQMRVHIDRNRTEQLGVPFSDINQTLRAAIGGDDLTDLNIGDKAIPIILQSSYKDSANPSDLTNLYVAAQNGELVSLSSIAYISEEGVAAELERHAQRRAIEVDAELPDTMPIAKAVEILRQLARESLPNGYDLILLGEAKTYQETDQQVTMTYLIAFLIVLLVLAAQFESASSALVVMLTVPFGIAAAIFAVWLTGTTINIYSQIGLVMLIGLIDRKSVV